jgi:hypothetical protein
MKRKQQEITERKVPRSNTLECIFFILTPPKPEASFTNLELINSHLSIGVRDVG